MSGYNPYQAGWHWGCAMMPDGLSDYAAFLAAKAPAAPMRGLFAEEAAE